MPKNHNHFALTMKFSCNKFIFACLLTRVVSFTAPIPLLSYGGAVGVTPKLASSSIKAMLHSFESNANSHHVKATAAALAFAALLMTANPAPLHEASHRPQSTTFPTLLVNNIETVIPITTTISKLEITPTPGFGFGGLGISPFGVGPFGAFGGGVVIRNVPSVDPELAPSPGSMDRREQVLSSKEQQLEAIVKQQQNRLEQYEQIESLQQRQKPQET